MEGFVELGSNNRYICHPHHFMHVLKTNTNEKGKCYHRISNFVIRLNVWRMTSMINQTWLRFNILLRTHNKMGLWYKLIDKTQNNLNRTRLTNWIETLEVLIHMIQEGMI